MTQDVPAWGSPEPEGQPPELSQPSPTQSQSRELTCPVCSGEAFREEEGKVETRWGMSNHILTMRICQRCSHVLFFYQGGGSLL